MADWKGQIGYSYNTPYHHSCAYGMMFQQGTEQNHGNLNNWGEAGISDISGNFNTGMQQAFYGTTAREYPQHVPQHVPQQVPQLTPEQSAVNGNGNYQGSGVYLGDAGAYIDNGGQNNQQNNRLLLLETQTQPVYDTPINETQRSGSETASDTESHTESHAESHTSPDSWSSGSSREGSLPQVDPTAWIKKDSANDTDSSSPSTNEDVSSSLEAPVAQLNIPVIADESVEDLPAATPKKQSGKGTRTTFSEGQMNALVQRFSMQRYLTPAEMKSMAEVTGLTYKQVKTWFQNRRMKLRRHQKDNSWVVERCLSKAKQGSGIFANMPPHLPPYQGETHNQHYNQGMVDMAAFKNPTPQNLAYYLSAAGSGGFPSWPPSTQAAAPARLQNNAWAMPPPVNHFEYMPNVFAPNAPVGNAGLEGSFT